MTRRISSLCLTAVLALAAACQTSSDGGPDIDVDGSGAGSGSGTGSGSGSGQPAPLQCAHTRTLSHYPWGVTAGTFLPQERVTFGILGDSTNTAGSRLTVEIWPDAGGSEPSLPLDHTFTTADRYKTCEDCMLIGEGCTLQPNTCRTYYFAQAGRVHVNDAGRSEAQGTLHATGANIVFAEWSLEQDAPVANGRCIEVTSFSMDAEWGDGGACSGDKCGSGCCSDSPYCTLGNNNIGRFCSDFCGESGDGCTGPNDCCDGFSCFLGTCIADTCGADTCTTGLDEGGGCCDQAAYCTDGRCSAACGQAGVGCGGDLDCCSGLSCTGGTCN